ncbi:hypothetical protein EG347_08705 [Chryseobacterium sp. G0186]|uniref:hypothetical protein n=1 Tax=Chryseobacterium sp. G0186 TaxID=2487064 RepID=UPI000F50E4ED|nr:hypothetical protein [Chryseobacterium sp. G0186]AZA77588.1 hypothetical protein EG347_08705 [Chryseobacterium sp. G0186]
MVNSILHILITIAICSSCINLINKVSSSFDDDTCYDLSTYKLIDTSAVYNLTEINGKPYLLNSRSDTVSISSLKKGLKFYKDGRVIEFDNKLSPKKLEGTYCINHKKSEMEFKLKHVQSGIFLSREKLSIKNDTIVGEVLPSPQTKGYTKTYVKNNN